MTHTELVEAMKVVQGRYKAMGVSVPPRTLAVLVVNHAVGDYRRYRGDSEYWSSVGLVEGWLRD